MRMLYSENTASYPRCKTDAHFADPKNSYEYGTLIADALSFVNEEQLLKTELWKRFADQFREAADSSDNGWRGEYWGKMMRGGALVYAVTRSPRLYSVLSNAVCDILSAAEPSGRISSYSAEREFGGWDIWCRKYVLLGMQYFLEICEDDALSQKIVASMCAQMDHIIGKIGKAEDGKLPITKATANWYGMNSCSILEPVVRLYNITGNKKYLNFADYIIKTGCADITDIFELATVGDFSPYLYPVTKAYEMISCFEGALEYYRATGNEYYKNAVIKFADRILETDFTVIGGSGCTHELFDHSTVRQANTTNGATMQETCVTVTVMKFLSQVHLLTGDPKYIDALEISFYNAYLGAFNTERVSEDIIKQNHPTWIIEPIPFDSYSPLTCGTRGNAVGGLRGMSDGHYYGCCACIGSAGIGILPKMQLMTTESGFALNMFLDGRIKSRTPLGNDIEFDISTDYPRSGDVTVTVEQVHSEIFELAIRIPSWSKRTAVSVNGEAVAVSCGYIRIDREWSSADEIRIILDMTTEVIAPIPYGEQVLMNSWVEGTNYMTLSYDREDPMAKHHIALRRGPVMLAEDDRLGHSPSSPIEIVKNTDGTVDAVLSKRSVSPYKNMVEVTVPIKGGERMTLTDYASAGKCWDKKNKIAVWLRIK